MYGLIGKMNAAPGQRDALAAILLDGTQAMPGCLSYVIARDPADETALWISEVWDSQASHKASLSLASVQAAIAKARPLIAASAIASRPYRSAELEYSPDVSVHESSRSPRHTRLHGNIATHVGMHA